MQKKDKNAKPSGKNAFMRIVPAKVFGWLVGCLVDMDPLGRVEGQSVVGLDECENEEGGGVAG